VTADAARSGEVFWNLRIDSALLVRKHALPSRCRALRGKRAPSPLGAGLGRSYERADRAARGMSLDFQAPASASLCYPLLHCCNHRSRAMTYAAALLRWFLPRLGSAPAELFCRCVPATPPRSPGGNLAIEGRLGNRGSGSRSTNNVERDDDSKKSHPALAVVLAIRSNWPLQALGQSSSARRG
jgi:hypothetical protein